MGERDERVAAVRAIAIGLGRELDEIGVAGRVLGEECHAAMIYMPSQLTVFRLGLGLGCKAQRQSAADDRLDAGLGQTLGEFERAKQIVGVGERKRRHALLGGKRHEMGNGQSPFEQRIGRVHAKMHEGLLGCGQG